MPRWNSTSRPCGRRIGFRSACRGRARRSRSRSGWACPARSWPMLASGSRRSTPAWRRRLPRSLELRRHSWLPSTPRRRSGAQRPMNASVLVRGLRVRGRRPARSWRKPGGRPTTCLLAPSARWSTCAASSPGSGIWGAGVRRAEPRRSTISPPRRAACAVRRQRHPAFPYRRQASRRERSRTGPSHASACGRVLGPWAAPDASWRSAAGRAGSPSRRTMPGS